MRSSKSDGKSRSDTRIMGIKTCSSLARWFSSRGRSEGSVRAMALEFTAAGADVAINWLVDDGAAQGALMGYALADGKEPRL